MLVTPIPDKNNPGRTYARIKDIPCVFPRNMSTPRADEDVKVMITGVHYFANDDGSFDITRPKMLFLRVVNDSHELIKHKGFHLDLDGKASANAYSNDQDPKILSVTSGRTGSRIDGVPGHVYVRKHDLHKAAVRAEGVADLSDLECHQFF